MQSSPLALYPATDLSTGSVGDEGAKSVKKAGQFEKVDYALAINGTIVMLVEAKARGQKAEAHDGQISRYFNGLLTTKIAIVTNGIDYRFFTDLRDRNVMDKEPFFIFNILEYELKDIDNLKFFHRDNFDAAAITNHAEEMVYVKGMTQLLGYLLRSPSEEFVRFLVAELGTVAAALILDKGGQPSPSETRSANIRKCRSCIADLVNKAVHLCLRKDPPQAMKFKVELLVR